MWVMGAGSEEAHRRQGAQSYRPLSSRSVSRASSETKAVTWQHGSSGGSRSAQLSIASYMTICCLLQGLALCVEQQTCRPAPRGNRRCNAQAERAAQGADQKAATKTQGRLCTQQRMSRPPELVEAKNSSGKGQRRLPPKLQQKCSRKDWAKNLPPAERSPGVCGRDSRQLPPSAPKKYSAPACSRSGGTWGLLACRM